MGNKASSKWYISLVCESLLTFFFYHFSSNLPTSLIIWVVLLFVCVLSTSLSLYKKLSVPASVIVSSLTRTKEAEPGGFFCLCVCRDFARVFLWTLLLSSSAVLGRKARLWYRLSLQIFISSLQGRISWSRSSQFRGGEEWWGLWAGALLQHLHHWRDHPAVMVLLILLCLQRALPFPSPSACCSSQLEEPT